MKYSYATFSDIGKRANNEDAYRVQPMDVAVIAIVADGLGGHINGEVASRIAADSIPSNIKGCEFDEDELGFAILDAHSIICKTKSSGCTTVAVLWINKDQAIAANVGDSRIYQFRRGKILYQSEDHSLVQVAISLGKLPADACRYHKDRNKVYNVLGDENQKPKVDMFLLDIQPGDCFLLCSDGFWEPVSEENMLTYLNLSNSPMDWLESITALIHKANDPKQDNFTAIAIFADEEIPPRPV